jgi:hypothetical protein
LEKKRAEDEEDFSHAFALELAHIIEHYGEETEDEAREVLELYMKGAESLTLAVAFAQRSSEYSSMLWKILIDHCLHGSEVPEGEQIDGSLFGFLLEAAALYGADLAHLVTQIPHGMDIEGLRPRLVAAVADYRLKLKMHESASEAATAEMISTLRELSHRSRRGVRYQVSSDRPAGAAQQQTSHQTHTSSQGDDEGVASKAVLPKLLRTVHRCDRHRLAIAPPIR